MASSTGPRPILTLHHRDEPGTTRTARDPTARRAALERAQVMNQLLTLLRTEIPLWTEGVVRQCMDPRLQMDLTRDDYGVRIRAMDTYFVAREAVTRDYRDWVMAGLEAAQMHPLRKLLKPDELTFADAHTAAVTYTFTEPLRRHHQEVLQQLARAVRQIGGGLARSVDAQIFDPLTLAEGHRLQVRRLQLPLHGQLILVGLMLDMIAPRLEGLYTRALAIVGKARVLGADALSSQDAHTVPPVEQQVLYRALAEVEPLFRPFESNARYSTPARRLILSLKPVFTLAAATDLPAFAQSDHPARRCLRTLTDTWLDVMDPADARHTQCAAQVNRLTTAAERGVIELREALAQPFSHVNGS